MSANRSSIEYQICTELLLCTLFPYTINQVDKRPIYNTREDYQKGLQVLEDSG